MTLDDRLDLIQDRGVYEREGIDPETVAQAKLALYKDMLELIGEDEKVTITDTETNDFGIDVEFAVLLEHQKKLL